MSVVAESKVLKIALDDLDKVWIIEGDKMPYNTSLSARGYSDHLGGRASAPPKIRVLGSRNNLELIVRLCRMKAEKRLYSLEIGSPLMGSSGGAPSTLIKMRTNGLPSTLGGWHEVGYSDCLAYSIGLLTASTKEGALAHARDLMVEHPVWKYIKFIPHIDEMAFTKVMGHVLDPRWFVDEDHPSRLSRLNSWLGLCNGPQSPDKVDRKFDVYSCWSEGLLASSEDISSPGWFILREGRNRWKNHKPWVANLRMSQLFVKYMRTAWMDSLYPYPNFWMERILDSDLFFPSKPDSDAFKQHMSDYKK